MVNNDAMINATKKWVQNVVIGYGLCPFAKREFDNDRIAYHVIDAPGMESQLQALIHECAALDGDKSTETTLLIFSEVLSEFTDFLGLLEMANGLLRAQGYEGIYQLASFHPAYCFADTGADDPSNYTNRSPYPVIQILREASIEAALKAYADPASIPARNIKLTTDMGVAVMKDLLADCYE